LDGHHQPICLLDSYRVSSFSIIIKPVPMTKPTFLGLPANRLPGIHFFQSLFKRSQFTHHATSSFLNSLTFHLINPHSRKTKSDAIRQTLTANEVKSMNDEAVLAAFAKGFFSGFAFAPEEVLLRLGAYKLFNSGRTGWCFVNPDSIECTLKDHRRQRICIKSAGVERQ
jgi:hypothetical protein